MRSIPAAIAVLVLSGGVAMAADSGWPAFHKGLEAFKRNDLKLAEALFTSSVRTDVLTSVSFWFLTS